MIILYQGNDGPLSFGAPFMISFPAAPERNGGVQHSNAGWKGAFLPVFFKGAGMTEPMRAQSDKGLFMCCGGEKVGS